MKSKKGFTLVEIMIVVVILGLIIAMATPMWQKIRRTSQDKTITNNLRQLYSAAQQYFLEQGASAATYDDLVGDGPGKYIRNITPVREEDYTTLIIAVTDTRVPAEGDLAGVVFNP